MIKLKHPFHLVDRSPWPLLSSIRAFILTLGLLNWFNYNSIFLLCLGIFSILLNNYQWWRDVTRERTFQGFHSLRVKLGIKIGMVLFICSEVLFFFSFFWAYFHFRLRPSLEVGIVWPPRGIETFRIFDVPLLNTTILLSSGVSVTWAHHSLIGKNHATAILSLSLTVLLGAYFTFLQVLEYISASFRFSDSCYGRMFFMATGFHGFHVIVGTIFLLVSLWRLVKFHFSSDHHFGFEAAAWYWHFVDVVWLFLYSAIYWWGG